MKAFERISAHSSSARRATGHSNDASRETARGSRDESECCGTGSRVAARNGAQTTIYSTEINMVSFSQSTQFRFWFKILINNIRVELRLKRETKSTISNSKRFVLLMQFVQILKRMLITWNVFSHYSMLVLTKILEIRTQFWTFQNFYLTNLLK